MTSQGALMALAVSWADMKSWCESVLGLNSDALQMAAGGMLFVLMAVLLRSVMRGWYALLVLDLVNEFIDLSHPRGSLDVKFMTSLRDMGVTMLVPTGFMLCWLFLWRARGDD